MFNIIKRYRWFIIITILGLLLLAGTAFSQSSNAKKSAALTKFTVQPTDLKESLTFSGEIKAEEKANLRFQTSGRLNWIGVKTGDQVKKYQALASLDIRDVRKNLQKELNDYLSERWDFEQTKDDNKNKLLTDSIKRTLEKTQFDLNNAVLDVELQSLSLEYTTLYSPISGIVTSVNTPVSGVNITPTTSEIEVVNPDSVYLSVLADQSEVIRLTPGMTAIINMDSYPEATIGGTIKNIAFKPQSGETSTVYEVKVILSQTEPGKYRLGMTGDVVFTLSELKNVLAIPSILVKKDQEKSYVKKEINGKPQKSWVEVGVELEDMTIINSGLTQGDIIHD